MTKNNAKNFELDGATYERKDSGYCYKDGSRIRSEVFEAAEREFDAREAAKAREVPGVREDMNPTFDVNGHHYVKDWAKRRYYRDGERISKRDWEREVFGEDAPKASGRRRPKDVAGEFETSEGTVTLTAKQMDFLHELADASESEDMLGNADSGWWCDVIADQIRGQFTDKPMTVGAMISTLCEKGLATRGKDRRNNRKVTTFDLTPAGREVWDQVNAE